MAEISTTILGNMSIRKVIGIPTTKELVNALESYYASRPTKYILWDLSQANLNRLTAEDLKALVKAVKKFSHVRAGGKTAIVVSDDVSFGMGRMLEVFMELQNIPFQLRVFRDFSSASEWLEVKSNTR